MVLAWPRKNHGVGDRASFTLLYVGTLLYLLSSSCSMWWLAMELMPSMILTIDTEFRQLPLTGWFSVICLISRAGV
jgi:hypothetical protein